MSLGLSSEILFHFLVDVLTIMSESHVKAFDCWKFKHDGLDATLYVNSGIQTCIHMCMSFM